VLHSNRVDRVVNGVRVILIRAARQAFAVRLAAGRRPALQPVAPQHSLSNKFRCEGASAMNRRIGMVLVALLIAGSLTLHRAYSQSSGQLDRKAIKLPNKFVNAPFSDGIVFGDTLYLAGRIGIDTKKGKVPEKT